jgi:hypothetical protein
MVRNPLESSVMCPLLRVIYLRSNQHRRYPFQGRLFSPRDLLARNTGHPAGRHKAPPNISYDAQTPLIKGFSTDDKIRRCSGDFFARVAVPSNS